MNTRYRKGNRNNTKINELLNQVKYLAEKVNKSLDGDNEGEFLEANRSKDIILLMKDGTEKGGALLDIGNFGIIVQDDNIKRYIYKHAVSGYYIND